MPGDEECFLKIAVLALNGATAMHLTCLQIAL